MKPSTTVALIPLLSIASAFAGAAEKPYVPFPDGFRSWQHVKSKIVGPESRNFALRGGIHHFYANSKALKGYQTGKFPNGAMLVEEIVSGKEGEGEAKGILAEGERRSLDVMVKNDRLYKESGGWGFEHFKGDDRTGSLPADVRTACYTCHSRQKDRDCVFTTVRK